MFDIQNYASFVAVIVVFQVVPGPGTLVILSATARSGIGAGFGAVAGTLAGDFVYMAGAVLGLAAVMETHVPVFEGLRWLGAAYLCGMGIRWLRAPAAGDMAVGERRKQSGWVYFRRAFTVGMANPKVILFFLMLFPLFLRADAPKTAIGAMMFHVTSISFVYQAGLVLVGNAAARRLEGFPGARRLATRLAGLALVGFGVRLALNDR